MRKRRCPKEWGLPLIPLPQTRASDHPVRPFHCLTYFLQKTSPREQDGSSALYNRKQPSVTQTALFRGHASCLPVPGSLILLRQASLTSVRPRGQVRKSTVSTLSITSLKPTGQFYIKSDQKRSHEVGRASSVCVHTHVHVYGGQTDIS